MSHAIQITGLVKTFGHTRALDGLDLEVRTGEVHAFLGPNGSGKSTTLRVLLGLLRADSGSVQLLGGDPWREATALHRRLAYVPGDVALWPNLTGGEVIDLLGRLRGGLDEGRRAELMDSFDLDPTTKCRAYSKGNRQKVALISALTSPVELYLLDEPTSGLDPLMEEVFRGCIDDIRDRGGTVLLSSHILAEAEALSDRVTIIRKGRTVASGSLEDLRHLTRTAITAQLADTATVVVPRLAGLAGVYAVRGEDHPLGVVYVVRAIGDTSGPQGVRWLTWLSPIGWQQLVRPYAGERWWLFAVLAGFALACSTIAVVLASRRDLGAGLLPDRPGPARAGFGSALGLAWRLQRGALMWWSVAFLLLGGVFGAIATSIGDMFDSPQVREFIEALGGEKALSEAFLSAEMGMVGVLASAYGVQAAARLRSEEEGLRAEPILAGAVGRRQWVWSHTVVALFGTAVLLAASGLAAGSAYAWTLRDADQVAPVVAAALVQIPAAWVMTALVVAAFGWYASGAIVGWLALVAFMLLAELGPLLKLDQWVLDLSPFVHVPQLPGAEFTATPLVWLVAIAAALLATGLAGIRRRDIA